MATRRKSRLNETFPEVEDPEWVTTQVERTEEYQRRYPPGSADDMNFRFTRRMMTLSRMWRARMAQHLRTIGQTQARWDALFYTSLWGGSTTQNELARRLNIEGPTLVRLLDKLEQDGLVKRVASTTDRRAKQIRITPSGEALVARITESTKKLRAQLLSGLTRQEIETGIAIFNKILGRFDR